MPYRRNSMANMIEIYTTADNQTEIKVQFDADTVWLSQLQMSELFGRDRTVITRHICNIFKDKELDKDEVCANFAHTSKPEFAFALLNAIFASCFTNAYCHEGS